MGQTEWYFFFFFTLSIRHFFIPTYLCYIFIILIPSAPREAWIMFSFVRCVRISVITYNFIRFRVRVARTIDESERNNKGGKKKTLLKYSGARETPADDEFFSLYFTARAGKRGPAYEMPRRSCPFAFGQTTQNNLTY